MTEPTVSDVKEALRNTSANFSTDEGNGVRITVTDESDVGEFYRQARINDWEFDSVRLSGDLVADVSAEVQTLGELFG